MTNDSGLMTTKELAQYLQLDRMTIYKLLKSGDIPANRVGHQWRFFKADIDEWIRSKKIDPASYPDIFDDIYLKRYATALIKRQWGANLSKFTGVQLLGGVEMNGAEIYSQATEEIQRLEEQIQLAFELPPEYMMG